MLDSEFTQRLATAIGDESVNSFARRAGVGESVLRSYFNGTIPRLDKIVAVAQVANVSIDWLATGRESIPKQNLELQAPPAPGAISIPRADLEGGRYTPEGVTRLALAIKATMRHLNYSERELARLAGLSHATVSKYAKGYISEPQKKVLIHLAPHVHRVIRVDDNQIEIDPHKAYGPDWRDLDKLATYEFERSVQAQST